MNVRLVLALLLPICAGAFAGRAGEAGQPALDPDLPYGGVRGNPVTYQVDFSAVVTAPYHTKLLKVWLPLPQSDAAQEVSGSAITTFPMDVRPRFGTEKLYGNRFAYFEFPHPEGAQIVRHKYTVKAWEMRWGLDARKVAKVDRWPAGFDRYLRGERLVVVDERLRKLAADIVPRPRGEVRDLEAVLAWVSDNLHYDHANCSLQASALHALENKGGHCSDYHGLCAALGRTLNYPTRVAYGINPFPKNSPSHCKLEVYLPPYGWVPFDVSETQLLVKRIHDDPNLDVRRKEELVRAARARLLGGFRDNTWFGQTRGTDYDLEPPARKRVAVVRTIYAEADGVALPEPDPANPLRREFAWMTVHRYVADRAVTNPFKDWRSLEPVPNRK